MIRNATTADKPDLWKAAREFLDAGLSACPAVLAKKHPGGMPWARFQQTRMDQADVPQHFNGSDAICIICGSGSGNLTVLDFDDRGSCFEAWKQEVAAVNPLLLDSLVVERSPSGGFHVYVRAPDCGGSVKLAKRIVPTEGQADVEINGKVYVPKRDNASGQWFADVTLIETKANGGLILCEPSPGYTVEQGSLLEIPQVTAQQLRLLLDTARYFDETPKPSESKAAPSKPKADYQRPEGTADDLTPWADYNSRGDFRAVLRRAGWTKTRDALPTDDNEHWTRPGKTEGTSATINGDGLLYVFSSNASPFDEGQAYNPFQVYMMLEHGGDQTAAGRALGQLGYGRQAILKTACDNISRQGTDSPPEDKTKSAPVLTTMVTRSYEGIEMESVTWLWRDRFPLGKLSLVAGVAGVGKTFFLCDTIARCSVGGKFADGSVAPLCESLILTAEDGAGDTIKPRLVAHGADCAKVHHYDRIDIGGKEAYFTLTAYLDVLRAWLVEHPAVKLIVFDPVTAFMGDKIDSHKNAEVRAALGPLCKLAEELGVAIIGITHLSKGQAKAINRVIGSVAFVAAARACWLVEWDPEQDGRRLFLPVKNNLAHADGLAYTITDGAIVWEQGPVTITADDLGDSQHTTPREEAEVWLRQALQDGRVSSAKLAAEATREGISVRTLKRAKKLLGVVSGKDGPAWYCTLPDEPILDGITEQAVKRKFDFGKHTG